MTTMIGNKVIAACAAMAAGTAVAGAITESLPIVGIAAAIGAAATSVKMVKQYREERSRARDDRRRTQPATT
jgi:serine acetyltransferase